jgi:ribonuclease HI
MGRVFDIYTDGACKVHTSKAGSWGFVIIERPSNKIIYSDSGAVDPKTTSPMMELMAVLEGVSAAINNLPHGELIVHSDSEVVIMGITNWITNWRARNWRTSSGKSVKNKSLWKKLYQLTKMIDVEFKWVKGHDGLEWNEFADNLCKKALVEYESKLKNK